MADDADIAEQETSRLLELRLAVRKPEGPKATGFCLNCDDGPLEQGHRWCDATCRDEWEQMRGSKR